MPWISIFKSKYGTDLLQGYDNRNYKSFKDFFLLNSQQALIQSINQFFQKNTSAKSAVFQCGFLNDERTIRIIVLKKEIADTSSWKKLRETSATFEVHEVHLLNHAFDSKFSLTGLQSLETSPWSGSSLNLNQIYVKSFKLGTQNIHGYYISGTGKIYARAFLEFPNSGIEATTTDNLKCLENLVEGAVNRNFSTIQLLNQAHSSQMKIHSMAYLKNLSVFLNMTIHRENKKVKTAGVFCLTLATAPIWVVAVAVTVGTKYYFQNRK